MGSFADYFSAAARALDAERAHAAPPRAAFGDAVRAFEQEVAGATARDDRPMWAQVLRVSALCSERDLRRAFRRRAFEVHPDRGGSHEAFLAVQRALEEGLAATSAAVRRVLAASAAASTPARRYATTQART